jgi:hypothetical protein
MTIKDIILYSILFILFIIVLLALISKSTCNKKSCKNCSTCSFGKCKCKDGYKGNDCEIDNRCEGKECKNSGSCVNGDCSCVNGWEGSDCGTKQLMSFNLSSGYTLKSKLHGDIYEYYDNLYRRLYNKEPTGTNINIAKIANIYFYDIEGKGKVGILKYNTPYNLVTINNYGSKTVIEPYSGEPSDCTPCPNYESLRAWPTTVPWNYQNGNFYISPINEQNNVDELTKSNIKQNQYFVISIIPDLLRVPPFEKKYMKSNGEGKPIIVDKLVNKNEIEKYIFNF